MGYKEPSPTLEQLTVSAKEPALVSFKDMPGNEVHVEYIEDIGWSIEVRYDLTNEGIHRQGFTGAQERLDRGELAVTQEKERTVMTCGDGTISIHNETGAFTVKHGESVSLESAEHPFHHHPDELPLYEELMSLKVTDFEDRSHFTTLKKIDSRMVRFQYKKPMGTVLGLAGQSGEMNRNGYRFELYNTDDTVHTPGRKPLYQSWPILFHRSPGNDHWVCVFHDNPSRTFVDIGDFYNDLVTFESQSCNSRVYVISGDTLADVSRKLSMLLGGCPLPPAWAFGYQQCRWSYLSIEDIKKIVKSFKDHDLPLDAMYYDIDYMDGFRVFTRNAVTFGEMAAYLEETRKEGIHSVCIVDPGVKIDETYPIYNRIMDSKTYLTNEDGSPFVGRVWAGESIFPDFGDEATRALWSDMQKEWLDGHPFDGVWNDMNEFSNFNGGNAASIKAVTKRGPIKNEWNLYGYNMAKASRKGMDKWKPDQRTVVITRSGYAGVQQHAVIWHGDNQAWWEHIRMAIDMALAYSLSGAYYTGPDVPGFSGNPPDDLAVRFFQLGAFLPLFRGHSIYFSKDKEPYAYGEHSNLFIRDAIRLRYSLMREWYTGFEYSVRTHTPPLEPVMDAEWRLIRDEMLLFGKILVCPVTERDQQRKAVYLPEGSWYCFGDPTQPIEGNQWIDVKLELSSIPVFVKAGSVVVRNAIGKNVRETLDGPETYDIYPDANGQAEGRWFNDDGYLKNDPKAERYELRWDGKEMIRCASGFL